MAPPFPSIQSFFGSTKSKAPPPNHAAAKSIENIGDGFTEAEVDAVLYPMLDENWLPSQEYDEFEIASLTPGPRYVTFQGRIANFYDQVTPSKIPKAAKGYVKVIVKDDTGAITVRLWYANLDYQLKLGQVVTIWTPHVSKGEHGSLALASNSVPLFTSIFPERDRSCRFRVNSNSDNSNKYKVPLDFKKDHALSHLMTLRNFVDGGYDIPECRILVCVKSIGAKKQITRKLQEKLPVDCLNIQIFDHTHSAVTFTLWGPMTSSATAWQPSQTILLLTSPGWRVERNIYISVSSRTLVDIDPAIPHVEGLRTFASRLARREDINPPFPHRRQADVKAAQDTPHQAFSTFAELDELKRAGAGSKIIGWVSVLLTRINLSLWHKRNMLLCANHCGVPMYGNTPDAICKQCSAVVVLRFNPKVLGPIIDKTGCSSVGKFYLSDAAWEQLLGSSKEELCRESTNVLTSIELRLSRLRTSFGIAWWEEEAAADFGVGRIWVWAVRT